MDENLIFSRQAPLQSSFHAPFADVSILVTTLDPTAGRGDLFVGLQLHEALKTAGLSSCLVSAENWYKGHRLSKTIIVMHPTFNLWEVEGYADKRLIGWARNSFEMWAGMPFLPLFERVFASSSLAAHYLKRFSSNISEQVIPIGADLSLFTWKNEPRNLEVLGSSNSFGTEIRESVEIIESLLREGVEARHFDIKTNAVNYFELPTAYGRTKIVIDDVQRHNKPFGPLNSRFFDATASGALVLTNTKRGLREIGFDHLPSWQTVPEAVGLAKDILNQPAVIRELTSKNHSKLLSIDCRKTLEPMILHLKNPEVAKPRVTLVFPDYRATNFYQDLVREQKHGTTSRVIYTKNLDEIFIGASLSLSNASYLEIHFDWLEPITQLGSKKDALSRIIDYVALLRELALKGVRITHTEHNSEPHEGDKHSLHGFFSSLVKMLSHEVQVMNPSKESKILNSAYGHKIKIERHPSYVGSYNDLMGTDGAKVTLGLDKQRKTIGIVGALRPYKGVLELVQGFMEANPRNFDLVLAGRIEPEDFRKNLLDLTRVLPNVHLFEGHIPDFKIMTYVRAIDVAVIPFRSITNSGSVILFSESGIPVILPSSAEKHLPNHRKIFYYKGSVVDALLQLDRIMIGKSDQW